MCVGQINLDDNRVTEYATAIHTCATTCIITYNSTIKVKDPIQPVLAILKISNLVSEHKHGITVKDIALNVACIPTSIIYTMISNLFKAWVGIPDLLDDGPLHCVTVKLAIIDKASLVAIGRSPILFIARFIEIWLRY